MDHLLGLKNHTCWVDVGIAVVEAVAGVVDGIWEGCNGNSGGSHCSACAATPDDGASADLASLCSSLRAQWVF